MTGILAVLTLAREPAATECECQDEDTSLFDTSIVDERQSVDQPPLPSSLPPSSFFLSSDDAADDEPGSSGNPFTSLASIFGRSSGSGFRSRAWAHWNLASSVRPTRQ